MENKANMKIVYLDEGNKDTDLQGHAEAVDSAFNELLPGYFNVNVKYQRVDPSKDELEMLENADNRY